MSAHEQRVGPYLVEAVMGHGGSAVVLKCRHAQTGGLAAVKRARDTSALQRDLLRKEISLLSRLSKSSHPGVVRVLDSGSDGGVLWYAMEFIDGPHLAQVNRYFWQDASEEGLPLTVTAPGEINDDRGTWPPVNEWPDARSSSVPPAAAVPPAAGGHLREALDIVRRIACSLSFVHGEGIVHGDLTPRNLLFRADGGSVIVDFGTALYAFAGTTPREVAQVERLRHGTVGYMAPEQILGHPLDARCDIYSLGCVLYELCAGVLPFRGADSAAVQRQHLYVSPTPLSQLVTGISPQLDALVRRLLAKDASERIGYAQDIADLLARELGIAASENRASSHRHLYRPRFAGRDSELARLERRLSAARDGRGGMMFVAGESGIGKTRLVNELGGTAVTLDVDVVVGQCSDLPSASGAGGRSSVLQPLLPLLHRAFDRCSMPEHRELARDLAPSLAALIRYEPTLGTLPEVAAHALPDLPHTLARARVFRSLAAVIRRLAQHKPLLLVLDDLHWADDLTLDFLRSRAAQELEGAPVLIVGTYRSEQVDEELRRAFENKADSTLVLARLDAPAVRVMARDMLASVMIPEGLAEFLHRHSEGNPFFAAEYLRAALQSSSAAGLGRASALATHTVLSADAPPVPASLHGLLELRMAGLSAGARALLELAAVLGREFDLERLGSLRDAVEIAPTSGDALAIEELVARQILVESGLHRYRFLHDKLREACAQLIPEQRRRELHGRAARRLALLRSLRDEGDDAELGSHFAQAGEPAQALACLDRAARRAEAMHATKEAIELYEGALRQCDALEGTGLDEVRGRAAALAESLADLLARVGRHVDARQHYDAALERVPPQHRRAIARLYRKKAQSFWTVHLYDEGIAALDRGQGALGDVAALAEDDDRREWLELQQGRFWLHYFARQTGPLTEQIIEAMRATVEQCGTAEQRSVYHICAALDILGRGRYVASAAAIEHTERAVEVLGGEAAHALQSALARFNLGFALMLGDRDACERAARVLEENVVESERLGDITLLSRSWTYLAVCYRRLGRVADVASAVQRAHEASEEAQLAPYMGAAAACAAWVRWRNEDFSGAAKLAAQARDWWAKGNHAFPFRWLESLIVVDLHLRQDQHERARSALLDLLDPQQQQLPQPLHSAVVAAAEQDAPGTSCARVVDHAVLLGYL